MSSSSEVADCEANVTSARTVFKNALFSSSSEEPPMEEWSSLENVLVIDSPKMVLFKAGQYDPGSGNICTKYIPMSDSEVLNHPLYNYPGIKDPGIIRSLFEPEDLKVYPLDGQELYLDLCKQMNIAPVRKFYRGMFNETIDLKYYGANPAGVRAMCLSLTYNSYVRRLDLSSNVLDDDACYHLGRLLGESLVLRELVLSACNIQRSGMDRLTACLVNRAMDSLDLSRNKIGDQGMRYLTDQIKRGTKIQRLNLSHNDLGTESALALAEAIEFNNTITHLDLSWNKLSSPKGINALLRQLSASGVLVELNLSWNALTVSVTLRGLLAVPTLRILDLSNNRLSSLAAKVIALKLPFALQLDTLDLSYNPLSSSDASMILNALRAKEVRLRKLLMENVSVTKEFVQELNDILMLSYRKNLKATFGDVLHNYALPNPDIRQILLRRMDFLTSRASKKCHLDTALYFLGKYKECELMQPREILYNMKVAGAPVDEDLVLGLASAFPGPRTDKGGLTIKLAGIVDMIQRLWPEKKLPPTPPEPEAEVTVIKNKKDKKKSKKKV